ncbi:carbohydrate porin [Flavihumibacter petaseus]|nr:carbohydrate porin [Flavihumibacter petaseus]
MSFSHRKWVLVTYLMITASASIAQEFRRKEEKWSFHFQLTGIMQAHPSFDAAYSGDNSLHDSAEHELSLTTTIYLGRRLWKGAAIYYNPEVAGGSGISGAKGIAGFTNGETFRIGDPAPAFYTARLFLEQEFSLGNQQDTLYVDADANQLSGYTTRSKLVIRGGKFALSDYFDDNSLCHNPRTSFFNWSLMSNGAWDYPANTRGYTWSLMAELILPRWSLRAATALVPVYANGPDLDWHYTKAHSETIEGEYHYTIGRRQGTLRALAYRNVSKAPDYDVAAATDKDVIYGKDYGGVKYGFGLNAEQEISDNLGIFVRSSWNDGQTATWAFTEIDRSLSAGILATGASWKRPGDRLGIAFVTNGISTPHARFLNSGGYGFIIGDGKLPDQRGESIAECFYNAAVFEHCWLTADYQLVQHPAYNPDRGPVHVFAARVHIEF